MALAGLVIALYSCQTEVDFPQLPYDARVVIQGIIEPDSVPVVFFNRTIPYLSGTTDPAKLVIRNASVTIRSAGETDHLTLDSTYLPLDCKYTYFYKGKIAADTQCNVYIRDHRSGQNLYGNNNNFSYPCYH